MRPILLQPRSARAKGALTIAIAGRIAAVERTPPAERDTGEHGAPNSPLTILCLCLVAAASLAFVAGGVPLLRHDWFPIVPSLRFAIANVTGWDPTGMGSVEGYPASFLLIFARSAVATLTGPYATHMLYFAAYALLLVFGAARLVKILGGSPVAAVAAALFAAFNPWTYTELVAGHGFMLLSYAATFWLVSECCARYPSPLRLVLLALAVAPQVQYLLVDTLLYAWLSLRMRSWFALCAVGTMLLPVFVGILVTRNVLLGTPVTLEWERGQSIAPLRAVVLRGYFTGYDSILAVFYEWSLWIVVAIAIAGVVAILLYRRRLAWLIAFAAIPLVWSFGLQGPLRDGFAWTIGHVPEAGVFRELYGLLGFVAVGYVAFCAVAAARFGALAWLWLAASVAMFAGWTGAPPQVYWVTHRALPVTQIANPPNSRFLLTPALYPARLAKRGSGTDPDLYPRSDNVTPVNESLPMFPLSPALGRYLRDGSTDSLGALSVTNVLARPWLRTDPSIRWQLALPLPQWLDARANVSERVIRVTPELSLGASPAIASLASNVGAGNVLFADAREATGTGVPAAWHAFDPVRAVIPGNAFVRAADGWVDARLAFVEDPELAQTYGGAVTTNSLATLRVAPGAYALVLVRGTLSSAPDASSIADASSTPDTSSVTNASSIPHTSSTSVASSAAVPEKNGAALAANTTGFRWIFIPNDVRAVRCSGLCVVAVQAAHVPDVPLNPPSQRSVAVDFAAQSPWLITATLPMGTDPLLRYNVTYDAKWIALYHNALLPHVRIDGAVNGWLAPPRTSAEHVLLLESGAASIALSEIASVALVAFLFYRCFALPANSRAVRPRVAATRALRTDATARSDSTT